MRMPTRTTIEVVLLLASPGAFTLGLFPEPKTTAEQGAGLEVRRQCQEGPGCARNGSSSPLPNPVKDWKAVCAFQSSRQRDQGPVYLRVGTRHRRLPGIVFAKYQCTKMNEKWSLPWMGKRPSRGKDSGTRVRTVGWLPCTVGCEA